MIGALPLLGGRGGPVDRHREPLAVAEVDLDRLAGSQHQRRLAHDPQAAPVAPATMRSPGDVYGRRLDDLSSGMVERGQPNGPYLMVSPARSAVTWTVA